MVRVEFHCHSCYSPDSLSTPDALLSVCAKRGIDRLVITDHNTISGALAAKKLDPLRVIIGEEVQTNEGELLAAFVSKTVPQGLPALEAAGRLKEQGAYISISHPFDWRRGGRWDPETLQALHPLIDAIEVFNSRCLNPIYNQQAKKYAETHKLMGTVGSDAHTLAELGRASMWLPEFDDAAGLRQAMKQVRYTTRVSSAWVRLASRYAMLYHHLTGWQYQ